MGCHNKEDPELIAEYVLEGSNHDMKITFSVIFCKDKNVFSDEVREEITHFTIRNPIVSQFPQFVYSFHILAVIFYVKI